MTLHLVFNPKSGKGAAKNLAETATRLCREHGAALKLYPLDDPSKINDIAARAVKAARADGGVVAAAGGDGTVRAVAHAARGTGAKVAVVPCGTFNYFARTHAIPEDAEAALTLALGGEAKAVRLASVNDETFILNASLGLYAKAVRSRKAHTRKFGRSRFVATFATLRTLLGDHAEMDVRLVVDGREKRVETTTLFVGNNALQMRNLDFKVADCLKADSLAGVTLKKFSGWRAVVLLFRGLTKTLEDAREVDSFCVDSLTVHAKRPSFTVALDGEMFRLNTPLEIRSLPESLNLVKPRA